MALRFRTIRHLDVTVLELVGRLTLGEGSVILREAVRDAVWNGHRKLALDYGGITYQDSSGNGEMVSSFTMVRNSGGELVIFGLTGQPRNVLQLSKLITVFPLYDSCESALAYFDSTRNSEVQITEHRFFHVAVLGIEGSLTEKTGASKVLAATKKALSAGVESVILLCPQVLGIDRDGADILKLVLRDIRGNGGDLLIAGVEERLQPAMSETGVFPEVSHYETIDSALKVFGLKADRSRWRIEVVHAG